MYVYVYNFYVININIILISLLALSYFIQDVSEKILQPEMGYR